MLRIDDYLEKVASQVRVKRIRKALTDEMRDHMELQKADYLSEGLTEEEAETRAVEDMGDALMVGGELDRVHRPLTQWKGVLAAFAVMLLGMLLRVFLYSNEGEIYVQADMGLSVLLGAGIIVLLGITDYTWWLRITWPVYGLWMLTGLYAAAFGPAVWLNSLRGYLFIPILDRLTPEMISSGLPLLTAMMICRMRGRSWSGFLVGLSAVSMDLLIFFSYNRYSLRYYPIAGGILLALGMLAWAVKRGFFRLDCRKAYGVLGVLAALVAVRLLTGPAPLLYQDIMGELVYPLLEKARWLGDTALETSAVQGLRDWQYLLPFMIVRLGWLPFTVLLAAMIVALLRCIRRFGRMENRMGALLGMTAVLTLCIQTVMYLLYSFTNVSIDVGLPLISEGFVMLLVDSVLAGVMLSVLRGEKLPESIRPVRRRARKA